MSFVWLMLHGWWLPFGFLSMNPSRVEYTAMLFGEIHGSRMYSSIFSLVTNHSGRLYFPLIDEAQEDQRVQLYIGGCALVRASFLGWSSGMRAAFS